jgi:nitronate monooxygenase
MTRLTRLLRSEHPIVLGPFGGASSVELAGAVADRGGVGSYGLYGYDAERIGRTAAQLRERTSGSIALNLWLPRGDEVAPSEVDLTPGPGVAQLLDEMGVAPSPPERFLPAFDEQLDAAIEARPAVLSFVYGVPAPTVVDRAHAAGIAVVATATTVPEAVALESGGVDAIVASGAEAAGHRVSFLHEPADSLVGTFSLVPQVADAVRLPVLAAGGIADRRGVRAAFALGAQGVVVGTAFLRTRQSAICGSYRRAILGAAAHDTVLTTAMSGRLSRGLSNRAMRLIDADRRLPFPAQNWLTGQFRAEAAKRDQADLLSLWVGQSAPLAIRAEAADVFTELAMGLPERAA